MATWISLWKYMGSSAPINTVAITGKKGLVISLSIIGMEDITEDCLNAKPAIPNFLKEEKHFSMECILKRQRLKK
jgi:hypothetical protein